MFISCLLDIIKKSKPEKFKFKDRQHRSRGGIGFSFITHKPRGVEYHVIYQMKAMISVDALVLSNKIQHVD